MKVSEIFASIQGEGHSSGEPSAFLRLALCNLRCSWCDTKYTWDFKAFDYAAEVSERSLVSVAQELQALVPRRLVITGGEPLLHVPVLVELLAHLDESERWQVEVETNGTLSPGPELIGRVDQWNVSPKLAHAGEPSRRRLVPMVLSEFSGLEHAWLKLVVDGPGDLDEVLALVAELGWAPGRVLLMPQATTPELLAERQPLVEKLAREHGFGTSSRQHVARWGDRRGV